MIIILITIGVTIIVSGGASALDEKVKVAVLWIGSNTALTLGKLVVGLSINSVSVLKEYSIETIHSLCDRI